MISAYDVRFDSDAGNGLTVREYLKKILLAVWDDGESFSGKRPFGNSGWEYDIYSALIKSGHIQGELDEDGYVISIKDNEYKFVRDLIINL